MPSVVNRHGSAVDIRAPEQDTMTLIAGEVRFLPIPDARAVMIAMLDTLGQFRTEDLACAFYTAAGHVSRQKRRGKEIIHQILTKGIPTHDKRVMSRPKKVVKPRKKRIVVKARRLHPEFEFTSFIDLCRETPD